MIDRISSKYSPQNKKLCHSPHLKITKFQKYFILFRKQLNFVEWKMENHELNGFRLPPSAHGDKLTKEEFE